MSSEVSNEFDVAAAIQNAPLTMPRIKDARRGKIALWVRKHEVRLPYIKQPKPIAKDGIMVVPFQN